MRLIITDSLERFEIALRTAISNTMSLRYGNLWYLSNDCFAKQWFEPKGQFRDTPYEFFRREINEICLRQKEKFIKHYFSKYNSPTSPPSWMIFECLSLGICTSVFRNLKNLSDKKEICEIFSYHPRVIESCLEPLRYIRNICAHHSILWNRWFVYVPKHIKAFGTIKTKPRSFHEQIFMINKLHQVISPSSNWKEKLFILFSKHEKHVPFTHMGFIKDWQNDPFWDN